jgi:hypothetical protein
MNYWKNNKNKLEFNKKLLQNKKKKKGEKKKKELSNN